MTETVKRWLADMYGREIDEATASMMNERMWSCGCDESDEALMHYSNYREMEEYIAVLQELKNVVEEK